MYKMSNDIIDLDKEKQSIKIVKAKYYPKIKEDPELLKKNRPKDYYEFKKKDHEYKELLNKRTQIYQENNKDKINKDYDKNYYFNKKSKRSCFKIRKIQH